MSNPSLSGLKDEKLLAYRILALEALINRHDIDIYSDCYDEALEHYGNECVRLQNWAKKIP